MAECDWCNDKDPLCSQRLCVAHPGMRGCCAGCVTEQLRAEVMALKQERDAGQWRNWYDCAVQERVLRVKAEARVKELEAANAMMLEAFDNG